MSDTFRYRVIVEVDVIGAEDETSARQAIFNLLSTPPPPSRGRQPSGARAKVTGVNIPSVPMTSPTVTADAME
jgi:hypothetical protein